MWASSFWVCFKYPWITEVRCDSLYLWKENKKEQKLYRKKQQEKKHYVYVTVADVAGGGEKKW